MADVGQEPVSHSEVIFNLEVTCLIMAQMLVRELCSEGSLVSNFCVCAK